ncbi:heat shock protein 70 kDa 12A [Ceratobasidium sp. AG-Ba]|nr:heat shock protein 70 kDa 12A [Ceratobasidium sp. AG-Ba]
MARTRGSEPAEQDTHTCLAVSFGAEALSSQTEEKAEDNDWQLAKYFKLHLHPDALKAKQDFRLEPLPRNVTLQQIYSDFLGYLIKHTQSFFEDRIIDGKQIWANYRPHMEIVIAHPNGWGIQQQVFLRTAAVGAGLAPASTASKQIRFVTEAEASVHFCIYHTSLNVQLEAGTKFAVCDAGGSTVDTTVYSVVASDPIMKLREIRESACIQAGAIFIDAAAEKYIRDVLVKASLDEEDVNDYAGRGVKDFERSAKRNFCSPEEDKSIEIAGSRFNNPSIRARRGRMTLPGPIVKLFFDPCVNDIVASVDEQTRETSVSYILLVGGLGNSPFLRQRFRQRYDSQGCQVVLTNEST